MKKIGRYRILGLLGKGGMGKVYKAASPFTQKVVAVKRLEPNPFLESLMDKGQIRRLFEVEARVMAHLRHPHLVSVWDYDEDGDMPFYVMEYYCNNLGVMMGESFQTEYPSRKLRIDAAGRYILQVLSGLARLHHEGVVHRDIKPYNILLTDQDTVKITDLGLSRLRGETLDAPGGLKVGSPYYAAPEQESNPDAADFSADVYSTGVMLYRMLTGLLPENRGWEKALTQNPDLDRSWVFFFKRALSPNPGGRYPDARYMAADLSDLLADWQTRMEKACRLPESIDPDPGGNPPQKARLRTTPEKIQPKKAQKILYLNGLMQPETYVENQFEQGPQATFLDRATGLLWERAGTPYPVTWHEALAHAQNLVRMKRAGRTDWRLPTAPELISLLTPGPQGRQFCGDPVFDPRQKTLWSSDKSSYTAAWYVSLHLGFVACQDFTGHYFAKAVSGPE